MSMVASQRTQTLNDFRQRASETLDRLKATGQPEMLTVDGEVRAVLVPPEAYEALERDAQLTRDVAIIQAAKTQIDAGQGIDAEAAFASIRAELLAIKRDGRSAAE